MVPILDSALVSSPQKDYLSPDLLPGIGLKLHSRPICSTPEYVPPILGFSETKKSQIKHNLLDTCT